MSITYTKKTISTAATPADMNDSNVDYLARLSSKTTELKDLGKTDGVPVLDYDNHSVTRLWVDDASASEWRTFVQDLNSEFGFNSTTVILDI